MADNLATLGIQITSNAKAATVDLKVLGDQAAKTEVQTASLAGTTTATAKATDALRASTLKGGATAGEYAALQAKIVAALEAQSVATTTTARAVASAAETQVAANDAVAASAVESAAVQIEAGDAVKVNSLGMRESLVLLREAARGNFTRMAGSASLLAQSFGYLNVILKVVLPIAALLGSIFELSAEQINKSSGDLTKGLGLTSDQLDKLSGKYGKAKEVAVTFMDVLKATFQVLGHDIESNFSHAVAAVGTTLDAIAYDGELTIAAIVGGFTGAFKAITTLFFSAAPLISDAFVSAENIALSAIQSLVNGAISGVNFLIDAIKSIAVPGSLASQMKDIGFIDLGQVKNKYAGAGADAAKAFTDAFANGFNGGSAATAKFFSDVAAQARKDRIAEILKEAGKAKGTGVSASDRASGQLQQLRDETAAQKAYNDELLNGSITVAQLARQEAIDNGVKSLVIKYNADIAAGTAKSAVEAAKLKPLIDALKIAYGQAYDEKMRTEVEKQTAALADQNVIVEKQIALAGQDNDARALSIALLKEQQFLLAHGIDPNSPTGKAAMVQAGTNATAQLNLPRTSLLNANIDAGTTLGTSVAKGILANDNANPMNLVKQQQEAYAEIDKLRHLDVLSETQAAKAKAQVDDQMNQKRLADATSFFGALSGLSSSSNKTLSAIGKDAALVQATISAYSAINKAWDSAPFPANLPAVAIVTAQTFANIAAIEGFASGVIGLNGSGTGTSDSIPAWLSAGESVITAAGTAGNTATLAAINAGAKFDGSGNGGVQVFVENNSDASISVRKLDDRRIRVIVDQRIADHAPGIVAQSVRTSARMVPNLMAEANRTPRLRTAGR